jgi:hypothetical protein
MLPEKECSDSVWNSYIGQYLYEQLTNTCMSSMSRYMLFIYGSDYIRARIVWLYSEEIGKCH